MKFDDVMMVRLSKCGKEACDEVLKAVKSGRPINEAVLDTIEALPARKTRELRKWLDEWEAYGEWLDAKKRGWRASIDRRRGTVHIVGGTAPRPSDAAVSAAIGLPVFYEFGGSRAHTFGIGHRRVIE